MYLIKVWKMKDTEFVKKSYNQLQRYSIIHKDEDEKYNWCIKLRNIFCICGLGRVLESQSISELFVGKDLMISKWAELLKEGDLNSIATSNSCKLYTRIYAAEQSRDFYLPNGTRNMVRRISQCRTQNG